ncbi:MAG: T9SS type A sorting domain-containing protein [Salibacteraceae bacterium]
MKKLFLILFTALTTSVGWAQCNASFIDSLNTSSANPYDVEFYNTSTGFSPGTTFHWTFQNGTPSTLTTTSLNPISVTFSGSGNYSVSLTLQDTNCNDSINGYAFIPNYINTTSQNASCGNCDGSATVAMSGGTSPFTYLWSSGDTTNTINNLCAGTYTVTVTDDSGYVYIDNTNVMMSGGGFSTNIAVSNPNPCFGDSVELVASASGGVGGYSFLWDSGTNDPIDTVTASGTYRVTVTDSLGCWSIDSVTITYNSGFTASVSNTNETCAMCCDGSVTASSNSTVSYNWSTGDTTATVSGLCPGTYFVTVTNLSTGCSEELSTTVNAYTCQSLSGNITQGENVIVYLIEEFGGVLTAVDSMQTDSNGNYTFGNVCNGTYYVKAALLPSHASYGSFVPTYFDSTGLWSQANALVVSGSSLTVNFSLLTGTFSGGPGFVGGLISQGANRGEGDPVANVNLILLDNDGNLVDFTTSNAEGEYSFESLALGSYELYVDMINKTSYPLLFELDEDNLTIENGNFLVFSEYIKPELPSGISSTSIMNTNVFPNPADDRVNVVGVSNIKSIVVYSILGEQVLSLNPLSRTANFSVKNLASGQYIMELQSEGGVEHHTLIKR